MDADRKRRLVRRIPVLFALTAVLFAPAGSAAAVKRDAALSAKARSAVACTCARDMVEDVTADSGGSVLVTLNVAPSDASVAKAIAKVEADLVLKGVPEARRVAVRDSTHTTIETYSRR